MKKKICKIHKKELTPEHNEFSPGYTGRKECTDCVDNLDFWLPMPLYIIGVGGMAYYSIFPMFPELRFATIILSIGLLLLFFMQGSTWRVLKRLFIKTLKGS